MSERRPPNTTGGRNNLRSRPHFLIDSSEEENDRKEKEVVRSTAGDTLRYPERPRDTDLNQQNHTRSIRTALSHADLLWDEENSKDTTVHLDLDVRKDLESTLEQLAQYTRLGKFDMARSFFRTNLESHLTDPYILAQYAELLFEQGDFKTMATLQSWPMKQLDIQHPEDPDGQILRAYWDTIQYSATSRRSGFHSVCGTALLDSLQLISGLAEAHLDENISSTEIKAITLLCQFSTETISGTPVGDRLKAMFPPMIWFELYHHLVRQGRFWDVHDLVIGMCALYGVQDIFKHLWRTEKSLPALRQLVSDWSITDFGGCSTLALLGVLNTMVKEHFLEPHYLRCDCELPENVLAQSFPLVQSITQHNPEGMKTRQYSQWMLTQILHKEERLHTYRERYKLVPDVDGVLFRYCRPDFHVPTLIFVPTYNYKKPKSPRLHSSELESAVTLAMRNAKTLQDHRTTEYGLHELLYISRSPEKTLEELLALEEDVQSDIEGLLDHVLTGFLVVETEQGISRLQEKLENIVREESPQDEESLWFANQILRSSTLGQEVSEDFLRRADHHYERISSGLKEYISSQLPEYAQRVQRNHLTKKRGPARADNENSWKTDIAQDQPDADQAILGMGRRRLSPGGPQYREAMPSRAGVNTRNMPYGATDRVAAATDLRKAGTDTKSIRNDVEKMLEIREVEETLQRLETDFENELIQDSRLWGIKSKIKEQSALLSRLRSRASHQSSYERNVEGITERHVSPPNEVGKANEDDDGPQAEASNALVVRQEHRGWIKEAPVSSPSADESHTDTYDSERSLGPPARRTTAESYESMQPRVSADIGSGDTE
ncbi:hypothetical protein F4780DRAFT_632690 [Xylariomycetidae sp. FL0641]|nr:hypothetical protein F4780DRAFT_632690 [Xylariomycetidae sp. FL0641]